MGKIVLTALHDFDIDGLRSVLVQPRIVLLNNLKYYLNNIKLEFTDKAIDAIAKIAYDKELGARGLRSIIEKLLIDCTAICNK